MAALKANSIPFVREGVYSQTIGAYDPKRGVLSCVRKVPVITMYGCLLGPRFESMAEIRFLAMVADVVGMTCAHEAILAQVWVSRASCNIALAVRAMPWLGSPSLERTLFVHRS